MLYAVDVDINDSFELGWYIYEISNAWLPAIFDRVSDKKLN